VRRSTSALILSALIGLLGACSGDSGDNTSTTVTSTTAGTSVTSLAVASTTTSPSTTVAPTSSVTTTEEPGDPIEFPEYTIVSREEGDGGATVVVLLDDESYLSLTDIDLANVLADVVERFPPILTAYVVDDPDAVEAVTALEPTADQQSMLDQHYLVRLEDGFRMVFTGPFSEIPIAILGS